MRSLNEAADPRVPLTPLTRELLRARSKALFGNKDRLEVAVAIAGNEGGVVNATDLAYEIGLVSVRVRAQLITFLDAGLLSVMPQGATLKRWYVRQESPFWEACRNLMETWIRELEQQVGDSVRR